MTLRSSLLSRATADESAAIVARAEQDDADADLIEWLLLDGVLAACLVAAAWAHSIVGCGVAAVSLGLTLWRTAVVCRDADRLRDRADRLTGSGRAWREAAGMGFVERADGRKRGGRWVVGMVRGGREAS